MSSSDSADSGAKAGIAGAAEAAWAEAQLALAEDRTAEISDQTVQQLLTAGAKLFAKKIELEDRYFDPFTAPGVTTATDVATTVSEMLRAADLNTFDLSMWFNRPR